MRVTAVLVHRLWHRGCRVVGDTCVGCCRRPQVDVGMMGVQVSAGVGRYAPVLASIVALGGYVTITCIHSLERG